jgi:hypothetical protein
MGGQYYDGSEIGCVGMDWIHVAQDKLQRWALVNLVNMVTNLQVP